MCFYQKWNHRRESEKQSHLTLESKGIHCPSFTSTIQENLHTGTFIFWRISQISSLCWKSTKFNSTTVNTHKHDTIKLLSSMMAWMNEWYETLGGAAGALQAAAGHLRSTTEGGGRWPEPMGILDLLCCSTTSPITSRRGQRPKVNECENWKQALGAEIATL